MNNLLETFYTDDFNITQTLPTEEDFSFIKEAKADYEKNSYNAKTEHRPEVLAITSTDRNKIVRRLIAAILLGWKAMVDAMTAAFIKNGGTNAELKELIEYAKENTEKISDYKKEPEVDTTAQQTPQNSNGLNIVLDKNNSPISFRRIIAGDTRYNPPARRHFIVGKKDPVSGKYLIVIRGSDVGPSYDYNYSDTVFFDSDNQALNFLNNINNINTKMPLNNFNYKITSKGITASAQITDLSDCILVSTICGPAYIYKYAKNCVESLDEKGNDMGKKLTEGCWGMPKTIEEVNKLKKLMMKPVDAFEVGDSWEFKNDELGIGDDTLFDNIGKYRREHPYGTKASNDVRKVIQDFIKDEVLPNWDSYGYSENNEHYGEQYFEDGVKEIFQEIADLDLKELTKQYEKEREEAQKKAEETGEYPAEEAPLTESKNENLEEKVRAIVKDFFDEKNSRLSILEYDDGYDGFVEEFGEDEDGHKDVIDFGVFTYNKLTDEDIEKGKPVITFLLSGGLNGSGKWEDYLKDVSKLFKRFKEELDIHAIVYKMDTDIADDVWTAEVLLYIDRDSVKESLNEDLIVIEPFEAKEKIEEIKKQIEESKDWRVRKNLLTLMDVYLFQTIWESDHEEDCTINKKEWEEYSDWKQKQGEKLLDEHPELKKEEEEREAKIEASVEDSSSEQESEFTDSEEKIEEDVEKHDKLNPKLFDNNHLKPEVREKCLEIVDLFLSLLAEDEVKIDIKDIIFTGSNASYNYTKDSDIDLHIIADTSNFDCPDNLYPKLYNAYKSLFNSKYDISFYGIPVEIYVETGDTPLISNGVYSVKNDAWEQEPTETTIPEIDWNEFMKAYKPWEDEYYGLIRSIDPETATDDSLIDEFITKVYELRHQGLANEGQYGFSNLIFKELRNRGHLQRLKDLKNEVIENRLTLEALTKSQHIDNKTRHIYRIKIGQISHNQPIIQDNGIFEIYNVKADDADYIIRELYRQDLVEYANKTAEKYDFSKINFNGKPSCYYRISGKIKI